MSGGQERQRRIASIALQASGADEFALAGSGAIREHGLIDRPTEDIDLFTVAQAQPSFESAVDNVEFALRDAGYEVSEDTRVSGFARLIVVEADGHYTTDIDMGIDWRASKPVKLGIGPVLDIHDAVGNKVAALFSRGEARDYLDVDSIRQKSRFSDQELLDLAANADPGFTPEMFCDALDRVATLKSEQVAEYRCTAEDLKQVQRRLLDFAKSIRETRHVEA